MSAIHLPGNTTNFSRWTFYALIFLAVYMPFEDFVLKWLPGSDDIFFACRFISELMILALVGWMVHHKISLREPFFHTPIDAPMLALIAAAVISLILNLRDPISDLVAGVVDLRPIFRYVLLFYVTANTPLSGRQVHMILTAIVIAGFLMAMTGLAQFAAGGALDDIFLPRTTDVTIAGETRHSRIDEGSREIGAVHGAATDTVPLALMMNTFLMICVARFRCGVFAFMRSAEQPDGGIEPRGVVAKNDVLHATLIPIFAITAVLTYARSSLVAIIAILAMEAFYWFGRHITLGLAVCATILLAMMLVIFPPHWTGGGATKTAENPIADFLSIFTVDYLVNNMKNQRLHHIVGVMPTLLLSSPFIGFGPDEEKAVKMVNEAKPSFLYRPIVESEFQDVYWVSFLVKFGLAGLLSLIAVFCVLFRSARMVYERTRIPIVRELSLMVMYMVIIAAVTMMLERCFELRVYSLYFWLLPGLMFSLLNHCIAGSGQRLNMEDTDAATGAS